tara:strand:+ start:124 stop:318 length:195 start_codon:yes stop_codon:yes gene_type:complete
MTKVERDARLRSEAVDLCLDDDPGGSARGSSGGGGGGGGTARLGSAGSANVPIQLSDDDDNDAP